MNLPERMSPGGFFIAYYTLKSSLLGELAEGEYKLKYGGYESEFTLAVQTFEAW